MRYFLAKVGESRKGLLANGDMTIEQLVDIVLSENRGYPFGKLYISELKKIETVPKEIE